MLEIYNTQLKDLLFPSEGRLTLTTEDGEVQVANLSQHPISNLSQFVNCLASGLPHREVGSNYLNSSSSRSHLVLTVHCTVTDNLTRKSKHTKLQFVDLAGSERLAKSGSEGVRLKEAQHINKVRCRQSLFTLSEVITAKQHGHTFVPYRNSLLTQILQSSFNPDSRVIALLHISPDASDYDETLSTLEFGLKCRQTFLVKG
jgi:kinesin family protein C2/C3